MFMILKHCDVTMTINLVTKQFFLLRFTVDNKAKEEEERPDRHGQDNAVIRGDVFVSTI